MARRHACFPAFYCTEAHTRPNTKGKILPNQPAAGCKGNIGFRATNRQWHRKVIILMLSSSVYIRRHLSLRGICSQVGSVEWCTTRGRGCHSSRAGTTLLLTPMHLAPTSVCTTPLSTVSAAITMRRASIRWLTAHDETGQTTQEVTLAKACVPGGKFRSV